MNGDSVQTASMTIRFVRGTLSGREFVLTESGAVIGRGEECELRVDPNADGKVSTRHGKFEVGPNGWTYTDLGSTNGSLVNRHSVPPNTAVPLTDGVTIDLGEDGLTGTVTLTVAIEGRGDPPVAEMGVDCPHCRTQFSVPRMMMGRMTACPSCQTTFEVPISARLFHDGSRRSDSAAPRLSGGASPAPPLGVGGAGTSEGILGPVKRFVKNFQERRAVQDEVARCERRLAEVAPEADRDLTRLGQWAWESSVEIAAGLPGGAQIASRHGELQQLHDGLDGARANLAAAKSELDASMARWSAALEAATTVQDARRTDNNRFRAERERAEAVIRHAIETATHGVIAVAARASRLRTASLAELDLPAQISEIGEATAEATTTLAEARNGLVEPQAVLANAVIAERDAAEALESAKRDVSEIEAQRNADQARLETAVRVAEESISRIRSRIGSMQSSLGPSYLELGRAMVERHGGGVLDPASAEFSAGAASHRERCEIEAKLASLRQRVAEL